jgi:hypothetical protein
VVLRACAIWQLEELCGRAEELEMGAWSDVVVAALRIRAGLHEFMAMQERLASAERAMDRAAMGRELGRLQQLRDRGNIVPELLDRLEAAVQTTLREVDEYNARCLRPFIEAFAHGQAALDPATGVLLKAGLRDGVAALTRVIAEHEGAGAEAALRTGDAKRYLRAARALLEVRRLLLDERLDDLAGALEPWEDRHEAGGALAGVAEAEPEVRLVERIFENRLVCRNVARALERGRVPEDVTATGMGAAPIDTDTPARVLEAVREADGGVEGLLPATREMVEALDMVLGLRLAVKADDWRRVDALITAATATATAAAPNPHAAPEFARAANLLAYQRVLLRLEAAILAGGLR